MQGKHSQRRRNSQSIQDLSGQAIKRDEPKFSSTSSRSISVKGMVRSRGSQYINEAPVRLITKRPLPSTPSPNDEEISNIESETLRTKPLSSKTKDSGGSKISGFNTTSEKSATTRLSERLTRISDSSVFHLFNNRIASSAEEVIMLMLANNFGFRHAIAFAADANWRLSAKFYTALQAACDSSNSSSDQM